MDITRIKVGDWGLSTSPLYAIRPTKPVYAISFGSDDQAGCVTVDGLPGPYSTARITPECPWLGTIDGDASTLIFTPYTPVAAAVQPLYRHTLDIILWHEKGLIPAKARAPLRIQTQITRAMGLAGEFIYAPVRGRKHVSLFASFSGTGTSSAPTIIQGTWMQTMNAGVGVLDGPTVYTQAGVVNTGQAFWSQNRRVVGAALTVGANTELDNYDALIFQVIPAAAQLCDVLVEAWD